jgi:hypothetical protein
MLGIGAVARAQDTTSRLPAPPLLGPGILSGVVADTGGVAIDSVDVYIASQQLRTLTRADGSFRFDKLKPGRYDVSARRIGYLPQLRRVTVGEGGGSVRFALVPAPRTLPPIVTAAARGGLSGVIGDTAYNIVAGAQISIMASDHRGVSDSTGSFFIPLNSGKYMVRVSRPGYESRMLSVTIPSDSGRRLLVWMMPTTRSDAPLETFRLDGLRDRLERRQATSTILTREDITRLGKYDLRELVEFGGHTPIADSCMAVIDGGPRTMPIWELLAADIETVEIYPPGTLDVTGPAMPRPMTALGRAARGAVAPSSLNRGCSTRVYAWLRK